MFCGDIEISRGIEKKRKVYKIDPTPLVCLVTLSGVAERGCYCCAIFCYFLLFWGHRPHHYHIRYRGATAVLVFTRLVSGMMSFPQPEFVNLARAIKCLSMCMEKVQLLLQEFSD